METKTLEQLRALARTAGLRGYSSLPKKQLIELLKKHKARPSVSAEKPRMDQKKAGKSKTTRAKKTVLPPAVKGPTAVPTAPVTVEPAMLEEHIESAKFEMGPPGTVFVFAPPVSSALHEDIEHLLPTNEPLLCLLPQKPGVVHSYWVLQHGAQTNHLRLRLCRVADDAIELVEEIEIPAERGHWYFHIPESAEPGGFLVQLGYYDAAGAFVSAIRRGVARIPRLYASASTDRRWWISEDEFRSMYLRAGGVVRGVRLLWPGSSSSPHGMSSRHK